jgi:hypothetical protein
MRRPAHRFLAVLCAAVVVAGACSGDDGGDIEAFCDLVRNGVGVDTGEGLVDAADYDRLLEVAPDDIEDTVARLANASRDLREIAELDDLFDAAFDPEAQAAREAFDAHIIEACGLDADALPQGRIDSSGDLLAELVDYVEANFANETWTSKVRYEVERDNGELDGVTVTFTVDSVGDEPLSVCNALRPWLYRIRGADGPIEVVSGDLALARSDGPDTNCVAL